MLASPAMNVRCLFAALGAAAQLVFAASFASAQPTPPPAATFEEAPPEPPQQPPEGSPGSEEPAPSAAAPAPDDATSSQPPTAAAPTQPAATTTQAPVEPVQPATIAPAGAADSNEMPDGPGEMLPEEQLNPNDVRVVDAHADRLLLFPTADTNPEGSFYFTAYELIFWQLGYSPTDFLQVTLTTWPIIVEDQPLFFDLNIKGTVLSEEAFRLALFGGATAIIPEDEFFGIARLGITGQYCTEPECWVSLHVGGLGAVPFGSDVSSEIGAVAMLGVRARLTRVFALLLEAETGTLTRDDEFETPQGALINYGVRFSGEAFAIDIGFLRPTEDIEIVLGLPWVAATYRYLP